MNTSNAQTKFSLGSLIAVGCIAMSLFFSGCNSDQPSPVAPLTVMTPEQEQQKELAISAKDKLVASLLGELIKSMGEQGPAKSIGVCKTRAPEIASQVGEEMGVRIGRTSFQLRNESNVAPAWAAKLVAGRSDKPVEVALPNDELGVLLPIRLGATCTLCHGNNQQVMPEVKVAIAANYPSDRATGFSEGDIRGYFWVEVPQQTVSQ